MDNLRRFQGDSSTRDAVKAFIESFIAEEGVKLMFDRKDVSHIADAKMLIDRAFEELHTLYAIHEQSPETINEAR